ILGPAHAPADPGAPPLRRRGPGRIAARGRSQPQARAGREVTAAGELPVPYALFLGAGDQLSVKTATGIAHWRPDRCIAQVMMPGCSADLGLPTMSPAEAASAGARVLVIGAAEFGGRIAPTWLTTLLAALEAGLDLAAGLHDTLAARPQLAETAGRFGG